VRRRLGFDDNTGAVYAVLKLVPESLQYRLLLQSMHYLSRFPIIGRAPKNRLRVELYKALRSAVGVTP